MTRNHKIVSISGITLLLMLLINTVILRHAYTSNTDWYWVLIITLPLLIIAIIDTQQKKHAIIRNYPIIGHLRYFFEQYFS